MGIRYKNFVSLNCNLVSGYCTGSPYKLALYLEDLKRKKEMRNGGMVVEEEEEEEEEKVER